eukprot:scaffold154431_cov33-Prasinocladus_malaysianus.AAC.1
MDAIISNYIKSMTGEVFAYHEMKSLTFKVAAELVLGIDSSNEELLIKMEDLFAVWFNGLFKPALKIGSNSYVKALRARKSIVAKLKDVLAKRRSGALPPKADIVSVLLQSSADVEGENGMTDDEIVDVCINLLFSGHETISCALTWTIRLLSEHPAALDKLRNEHVMISKKVNGTPTTNGKKRHAVVKPEPAKGLVWEDYGAMEYTRKNTTKILGYGLVFCPMARRVRYRLSTSELLIFRYGRSSEAMRSVQ